MGSGFMNLRASAADDILSMLNAAFEPSKIASVAQQQMANPANPVFQMGLHLVDSYKQLGIRPTDAAEEKAWRDYLDFLKKSQSDQSGVTNYDRIFNARKENLESAVPRPMFTMTHMQATYPRVIVGECRLDTGMAGDPQQYVIISSPITPTQTRRATRKRA